MDCFFSYKTVKDLVRSSGTDLKKTFFWIKLFKTLQKVAEQMWDTGDPWLLVTHLYNLCIDHCVFVMWCVSALSYQRGTVQSTGVVTAQNIFQWPTSFWIRMSKVWTVHDYNYIYTLQLDTKTCSQDQIVLPAHVDSSPKKRIFKW